MKVDWSQVLEKLAFDMTGLVVSLIQIVIVFVFARIALALLTHLTSRVIKRAMEVGEKKNDPSYSKSITTSMTLTRSVGRYLIYFAALAIVINLLGYGSAFSNVVTAAGVGALVISLGAQSIIKDVIAGFFIMFEHQYAVGDYVKINDSYDGTVTSLAMRCTYLKTWKGQQIIIPNGQITTVINYSGEFNMAIVDVPVPYEEDPDRVLSILKETATAYYMEHPDLCFDVPNVVGINSFDDSSVGFSIYQKAVKRNHYRVQRDLRTAIVKRFNEEGISIPYSQIVVHEKNEA